MTIAPGTIVKDFNVIEDVGTRQVACFIDAFADTLLFQGAGLLPWRDQREVHSIDKVAVGRHR
jgi:hypothetical protein